MYIEWMKAKKPGKKIKYEDAKGSSMELNDALSIPELVRTQVYLTREEHQFLQGEANRRGATKAAVLRGIIDDRMRVPEGGWAKNPLLAEPVEDSGFEGRPDGATNHDEYIYGTLPELEQKR